MAIKRDSITLVLAGIGALTGLSSLSLIVWEQVEYRPRVEITSPTFVESQEGSLLPRITAYVGYKNLGTVLMNVYEPPLLVVRDSAGKQFGPYLMRVPRPGIGRPVTAGRGPVRIEPQRSEGREYLVPGLEEAIANGQIPGFRSHWRDFTYEVEALISVNEDFEQSVHRQSFEYKSYDGRCMSSGTWCTGAQRTENH